jgi:hypothetical protein
MFIFARKYYFSIKYSVPNAAIDVVKKEAFELSRDSFHSLEEIGNTQD